MLRRWYNGKGQDGMDCAKYRVRGARGGVSSRLAHVKACEDGTVGPRTKRLTGRDGCSVVQQQQIWMFRGSFEQSQRLSRCCFAVGMQQ